MKEIFIVISCIFLTYLVYLLIRNELAFRFLRKIGNKVYQHDSRLIKSGTYDRSKFLMDRFTKLISIGLYTKVLLSLKRLRAENFFPKEFIEKLES